MAGRWCPARVCTEGQIQDVRKEGEAGRVKPIFH